MDYQGKTVLVLGLGESGLAMVRWLLRCGAQVRVADTRAAPARLADLPSTAQFVAGPFPDNHFPVALIDGVDFVAVSPGLAPNGELADLLPAAQAVGTPVWGEIELFAQGLKQLEQTHHYQPKIIAITGTNGKTTVTSMVGMLCQRSGLSVRVAGNISPAALDVLIDCVAHDSLPQVWVLELSSFQLQTTYSLTPDAATVLNVTQDHLDWHGSMEAYAAAKARIFAPHTVRVLNREDARVMAMAHINLPPVCKPVSAKAQAQAALLQAQARQQAPSTAPGPVPDAQEETVAAASDPGETVPSAATVLDDAPPLVLPMAPPPERIPTLMTFGTDEPQQPDALGLLNERGVQWLVETVVQDDGEKKRRRKGAVEVVEVTLKRMMPSDALKIRGQHNAANVLAALGLCRGIGLPLAPLLHAVRDYQGEPHRVEWLQSIAGVDFYDDSKGTNVGATVAAIKGLGAAFAGSAQRLVLILGGDGKGQDFSPLQEPVARHVRAACLIGRDAPLLKSALQDTGIALIECATLEQAVEQAAQAAHSGDAVLLSPACASLDMFRNYAHRADVFVAAVREWALQCGEVV